MPDPHGTVPKYSTQYSTIHRMLATITTVSAFSSICAFTPTLAMPQASASETASSTTITQVPDPLVSYTFSSDDGSGKVANSSSTSQFGSAQIMIGQDAQAQPAQQATQCVLLLQNILGMSPLLRGLMSLCIMANCI